MVRAYVPGPWERETTLPKEIAHHLTHVLRLGEGDTFVGFDGAGTEGTWRIHRIKKREVVAVLEGPVTKVPAPKELVLVVGALKSDTMDTVVRQATEMGATRIVVVTMARSVVPPKAIEARMDRLTRIAREACAQSGRAWEPSIETFRHLEDGVESVPEGTKLVFWERSGRLPPRPSSDPVTVVVGPEGGLEEKEVIFLENQGFYVCSLGPTILRADTAVVAALALSRVW